MTDFSYYFALARDETPDHPDAPQCGRWRMSDDPVAIWRDPVDDKLRVLVRRNRLIVEDTDAFVSFATVGWAHCKYITQDKYDAVMAGEPWDNQHPMTNLPPPDDSLEAIAERIADLEREAKALIEKGAAKTKEEADRASDLKNLLGDAEKAADELRTEEKAPALQQCREIDAKWATPINAARNAKNLLAAKVIAPFLQMLKRERDEAEFQALTRGEKDPHPAERVPVTAGSPGRRSVALRTVKRAIIEDQDALYNANREHPKVRAVLQDIADAAARANIALPGMRIIVEERAA